MTGQQLEFNELLLDYEDAERGYQILWRKNRNLEAELADLKKRESDYRAVLSSLVGLIERKVVPWDSAFTEPIIMARQLLKGNNNDQA